ncbi:hypothetical protein [Hyalangium rubrum]|uniref:DUF3618 domain-containing protein n=1 Tax=Hyalangium rubrum TaxID=3103134 RepID=A0ABU5HGS0_9BACT|nr:hypothetical protein [Hyalangium sp. s54d21]MDY7232357.1 hypothetical protein [Hyalangium sp. s54d21]
MNEWGHLEQRNENGHDTSNKDRIFRSPDQSTREQMERTVHDKEQEHEKEHALAGKSAREQVERTADRIRDELMLTLEELERRRERVLNVRYQASRHQEVIIGAAVAALVLTGVGVGVAMWRARHREQILARQRIKAVQRAWQHPARVASSAEQRPLAVEMGRKLIMIFGTALATSIARSSVQSLVPQRAEQK